MKEKITLEEHRKMLKKKADKISEIINGLAINGAIGLLVNATLISDLQRLPALLDDKAMDLLTLKNKLEELKFNVKTQELGVMRGVESEQHGGKPIYSNIGKRQAESEERLSKCETYQNSTTELNNLKVKIDNLVLQHQFCKDKFSAAKAMSRIVGGE